MAITLDTKRDILTVLGFPCDEENAQLVYTGATPSAGILSAVTALGATDNDVFSQDTTQDSTEIVALQALVSGEAWTAFITYLDGAYLTACATAMGCSVPVFQALESIWSGQPFQGSVASGRSLLSGVSITPRF